MLLLKFACAVLMKLKSTVLHTTIHSICVTNLSGEVRGVLLSVRRNREVGVLVVGANGGGAPENGSRLRYISCLAMADLDLPIDLLLAR